MANIEEQQRKSAALCKAMGWTIVEGGGGYLVVFEDDKEVVRRIIWETHPSLDDHLSGDVPEMKLNLYDPDNVRLAWRVLNRMSAHPNFKISFALDGWWLSWNPLTLSLDEIQSTWLDKCYELLVKGGVMKYES